MAISRIPGFSLLANLDRQGTDISLTSSGLTLQYWDVTNYRIGINNSAPQQTLDVSGNILTSNGHVYTNANVSFDIGTNTNWWHTVYAESIQSVDVVGTLLTNAQPNITSIGTLANLSVTGNLSVDGNLTVDGNLIVNGVTVGNLSANTITANVFGNITGYVLQGDQPFITNLGDITVSNITITGGNLVIGGNVNFDDVYAGNLYQSGNRALDTTSNLQINGDVVGYGFYNNINLALTTTGVTPGTYGSASEIAQFSVDDNGRILSAANIVLSQIGNLTISNTTISSAADLTISTTSNGNIYLDAGSTGVVQIIGSDAIGIPSGDNSTRPLYPGVGYTRYNTDRQSIEYYDGNSWLAPGAATISSEIINPDGTANTYTLGSNTSVDSILVSINGTLQQPIYSYNIVNNNQITFTETPLTSDIIEVRFISVSATSVSSLRYGPATAVTLDIANVNVTGNILPSANVTYSLGSESLQWKDLWVSGNTVYIGGAALTVVNGQLSIGGNTVGAADPYGNINVAAYLGGSFSVGTITAGTWNGGTIGVAYGGTGGTTATQALTNLLPSGASTGLVLTTGGSGSYYWASPGGGGGATVGQTITTLRQSNTATQGQTVFTLTGGITYTPGAEQLSVFINGVRQFPSEYTETASNVFTLNTGINEGDVVFAEINKSQSFDNYANLTYASNIGNIAASGLTVQAAIESLENNKAPLNNPVFTSGTWNGGTIGVAYGGTGATTTSGVGGALDNLLPSGEQTGYVLSTSGAGSYSWVAPTAGGTTVGQQLTTTRQSNTIVSNTSIINLAGISYTPGAGQLRVYINGVRQFPAAYTETSNVSYTLSANVVSGDTVFTEIDQFSSFNNYANLTYASNVGNIAAAGLTVQSAIESLENNKAPLASPVFTGVTTTSGNLVVQGNLFVNGNLTTINANNLNINDSLIYLADDNPADTLDIGFVSAFTNAVRYQHTGFVRDATDGVWKLFANVVAEPTTTVDFTNATYSNLLVGNLSATSTTVSGNVQFTGWSIRETGTKLYFAYNGINKMSLDTGGNLVVTGDITAFGTIT